MKKLLLVTAASLVVTSAAHAHTSEKVLFTCEGELTKTQGANAKPYYDIVESWKAEGERDSCDIGEGEPLRQILTVCRVGDFCTVAAKRRKRQWRHSSDSRSVRSPNANPRGSFRT